MAQLRLLKGGRDVGVTTYWHFGRLRYFTVPLDDVSCRKSRTASPSYVSMKIRGHWMYFMLDVRDGRFHEPELFDYVIGLNRSLKWTKISCISGDHATASGLLVTEQEGSCFKLEWVCRLLGTVHLVQTADQVHSFSECLKAPNSIGWMYFIIVLKDVWKFSAQ